MLTLNFSDMIKKYDNNLNLPPTFEWPNKEDKIMHAPLKSLLEIEKGKLSKCYICDFEVTPENVFKNPSNKICRCGGAFYFKTKGRAFLNKICLDCGSSPW